MPNIDTENELLTSIRLAQKQLSNTDIRIVLSEESKKRKHPIRQTEVFLTVVIRTLGNRNTGLIDCLLSLQAQTNQDFEVLLVGHNLNLTSKEEISKIISQFPVSFREKIIFLEMEGGTRVSPLNLGLKNAAGRYLSVLDDDDIVFAHWVEEFQSNAHSSYPRALRAVVVSQNYSLNGRVPGISWPEANSWPSLQYPTSFSLIDHLLVNRSPFMSFAFPVEPARLLNLSFDEELQVVEDWDFILQFATTVGVHDFPVITAIYRKWNLRNQSIYVHSISDWKESEQLVLNKYIDSSILIPPGSFQRVRQLLEIEEKFNSGVERILKITGRVFPILLSTRRNAIAVMRKLKRALNR